MPGIPDVYQGTELWEDSLVDPDNRRPVDFAQRREVARVVDRRSSGRRLRGGEALGHATALRLRRDRPELFTGYTPVPVSGPDRGHAIAYDRGGAADRGDPATHRPRPGRRLGRHDVLGTLDGALDRPADRPHVRRIDPLTDLLGRLPVALLTR